MSREDSEDVAAQDYLFWGLFLLCSAWGKAVMQLRVRNEPGYLRQVFVYITRFFYKLCEIRKVSDGHRQKWYSGWSDAVDRIDCVEAWGGSVVWPLWASRRSSPTVWDTYVASEYVVARRGKRRRVAADAGVDGRTGAVGAPRSSEVPRPPCPLCRAGAAHVAANAGGRWLCYACGRSFRWRPCVELG